MELSFTLVILIVIGVIILIAVVVMFWNTIAKFLGISQEVVDFGGYAGMVSSKCDMECLTNRDAIRAGATWQVAYDLNGDAHEETIKCTDGSIVAWGNSNQPRECKGIGCVKTCSCIGSAWYQAPKTC
jgi:hypothetical protein